MTLLRLVVAFGALSSANSYATELRCRSFAVGDVIMRRAAVRSDDTYLRLTDATGAVVACGSAVDAGATLTATLYQNDAALEFESHDVEYLIDARSGAAFTLTDTATMVEDDAYVVEFTKLIEEAGEQTVGADQFIWSYGSRSLGFHGDDVGALTLDLETCAFSIKEIEACRRGRSGPTAIHIACNVAALILAVAGVAVAASAIDRADNGEHLRGRHPKIGVGVMAAVGAMVLMGFARPGKDAPKRVYFNYVHTGLGYAAVVLAAAATRSGISKAADLGHVADDRPWFTAQSAMLGVALAAWLVVAAAGVQKRRDAKPAAAAAVDGADGKGPARVDEEEEAGEAPPRPRSNPLLEGGGIELQDEAGFEPCAQDDELLEADKAEAAPARADARTNASRPAHTGARTNASRLGFWLGVGAYAAVLAASAQRRAPAPARAARAARS
ncbi:succinate transmembrane transporter [Aureococcus anophagefferens]|nr:succinate transmembrane transporter [Aureococcus anophagefferens]